MGRPRANPPRRAPNDLPSVKRNARKIRNGATIKSRITNSGLSRGASPDRKHPSQKLVQFTEAIDAAQIIHRPKAIAIKVSIPERNQRTKYELIASNRTTIAANSRDATLLGASFIATSSSAESAATQLITISNFPAWIQSDMK